jgi:predicted deacylase
VGRSGGFFDDFREADEFSEYLDALVGNYSSLLSKFVAGTTCEGRTIYGARLSTGGANKPTFFIQANVHAREWLAPTTNLWVLTGLVEDYVNGTAPGNAMAAKYDWYIVPMVNMDGYIYTWTNDRLWRKNRRVNSGSNARGVDINRNWPPAETWCTAGSSTSPSSDTYCGTGPASEPETAGMVSFIDTLPNLACAIDFHCYGPLVLYPFQYSYNAAPEPYNTLVTNLGRGMASAINAVHGSRFEAIQGSDLYPHSGGLIDYTYFTRGVPAFTVELRGNSFIVPASDIVLAGEESYAGVLQLAQAL